MFFTAKLVILEFFLIKLNSNNRLIPVEFAATAARLEQIQQINKWGECEDAHDTEREDMKRKLASVVAAVL